MARSTTRTRAPKAAKVKEIPHQRASDFRSMYADGALIRLVGPNLVITFYEDDRLVERQTGQIVEEREDGSVYELTHLEEQPLRTQVGSVRIPILEGAQLARLMLNKVSEFDPKILEAVGIRLKEEGDV